MRFSTVACTCEMMMQLSSAGLMRGRRPIGGCVGGDPKDALSFGILTGVRPMVEVFLEQAALALDKMMPGKVHFRSVLKTGGRES